MLPARALAPRPTATGVGVDAMWRWLRDHDPNACSQSLRGLLQQWMDATNPGDQSGDQPKSEKNANNLPNTAHEGTWSPPLSTCIERHLAPEREPGNDSSPRWVEENSWRGHSGEHDDMTVNEQYSLMNDDNDGCHASPY